MSGQVTRAILADASRNARSRPRLATRCDEAAHVVEMLLQAGGLILQRPERCRQVLDLAPAAFDFAEDDLEFFDLVIGKSNGAVSSGAGGFYVHFGFCWFVAMDWCSWANRVRHASGDP